MDHPDWRLLWAKSEPTHPLWRHLLDAAAVSTALKNPLASDGFSVAQVAFLVGIHDVGKAEPVFQHQVGWLSDRLIAAGFPKTADAKQRHEIFSAIFLGEMLREQGTGKRLTEALTLAVAAHHGHWVPKGYSVRPPYACAQSSLCQMLQSVLGVDSVPVESADLSAFGIRLAGQIVLCDWIASNEGFYSDLRLAGIDEPAKYFEAAKLVGHDWVARLDLNSDADGGRPRDVVASPRGVQTTLLDLNLPPGLVIVEAPMGEGKTEAAWILAEQWRSHGYAGAYMALPTQATSDSLFSRYQSDYLARLGRRAEAKLVHGMAWLRDDVEGRGEVGLNLKVDESAVEGDIAAMWFRPTRRALLADHGVGTVDQCLLAALNCKFGFLRLYGLDGRVLVIDEVHAYDAYMNAILQRLLAWCASLQIPVVLLSATLSAVQRDGLLQAYGAVARTAPGEAPYPLITFAQAGNPPAFHATPASSSRELTLRCHPGMLGDAVSTAAMAEAMAAEGNCVCVIANTVRQAQAVYRSLTLPQDERLLFHARFTAADRERLATTVLKLFGKDTSNRPDRFVLVATQVVEQSLDVDFDAMISEIAPMDLLLQRSGRLHRHRVRSQSPVLHVLTPDPDHLKFGGSEWVYSRYVLLRTLGLLGSGRRASLPGDFRPLIEGVYGPEGPAYPAEIDVELPAARTKWEAELQEMADHAAQFLLRPPNSRYFEPVVKVTPVGDDSDDGNGWRAKTRLGANERTCLFAPARRMAYLRTGKIPMKLVRELYRGAVRVPIYVSLQGAPDPELEPVVADGKLRGLTLIPYRESLTWTGDRQRLNYDDEIGLTVEKIL